MSHATEPLLVLIAIPIAVLLFSFTFGRLYDSVRRRFGD